MRRTGSPDTGQQENIKWQKIQADLTQPESGPDNYPNLKAQIRAGNPVRTTSVKAGKLSSGTSTLRCRFWQTAYS
ncbi:hypothetical protein ACSAZL_07495 [Methanosarcina sp. T3]|uniref:hypothetical protein n=1 Tax=Methanosarcina sp. T3 TaxID=3439062 RepID=UPI003F86FC0B